MTAKLASICSAASMILIAAGHSQAAAGLAVTYGSGGLQTLSFNGVVLEDVSKNSADAFHIWHMKATDLEGNLLGGSQYTWGESNSGRNWNVTTHTWTYQFVWGSISVQFTQAANTLTIKMTETNKAGSGIIFDGATAFPVVLHFPELPAGFVNGSYQQLAFNTMGPSVTLADYGQGEVAAVNPDALQPLYTGFIPTGANMAYTAMLSSTAIDDMASFYPHYDRPVAPGQTESFTVSLRFAASGTASGNLAPDAYQNWAKAWPPALKWNDRRIIGTVYLATSPQGNPNLPGGYPNNPRRYFNDGKPQDFDVRTPAGLAQFQARILQQAHNNVQNLQRLNAQGAITWDIEGEQFPQATSYVCEPDEIAQAAPEMETVITDAASGYGGMKLDDAYFKIMRDAGFRVGVCARPQHFTLSAKGTASQVTLPDSQVAAELIRKMQYAHNRWGATLFYVDSDVESSGWNLDPSILQKVSAALPDSLVIPEEGTPKYYAYTAPFKSFLFHTDLGTATDVYNYYPRAFSASLVNDVDAGKLAEYRPQLTQAVRRGDILMVHADFWQANNPVVVQIYQDAQGGGGIAGSQEP